MTRDLTVGKVTPTLFKYTLPMFISVLFQQMYNLADSSIAGKFAGEDALASIGASYPITMIFMAICTGCNIGCTVILSQCFGAKRIDNFKTGASTSIIFGILLSIPITAVAVILSPQMLSMVKTPVEIFTDARIYLRVYMLGFGFLFLYNMINGIFNAMGDSRTPLYFLIASSIGNVFLDVVFVAVLKMGVLGAALATLIAQGIACFGAFFVLVLRLKNLQVPIKPPRFSFSILGTILFVAIPTALQSSFVSVGNLLIQSLINSCGKGVIAGFAAAFKLNTIFLTGIGTISGGVSAFTAQNIGAKKFDRVQKGLGAGILVGFSVALPIILLYTFCGSTLLTAFLEDGGSEAMTVGRTFLIITSPFYFFVSAKLICDGVLKGTKSMLLFMISTFTDLILRVLIAYALFDSMSYSGIFAAWPVGWIIGGILSVSFYFAVISKQKKLLSQVELKQ